MATQLRYQGGALVLGVLEAEMVTMEATTTTTEREEMVFIDQLLSKIEGFHATKCLEVNKTNQSEPFDDLVFSGIIVSAESFDSSYLHSGL